MGTTVAFAGDTMLGRGVAEFLGSHPAAALFAADLIEVLADADGLVLNLECAISERGSPRSGRLFHFRAPPVAVDALTVLGVKCVSLANNHALDYGDVALLDTIRYVRAAGIAIVGAGESLSAATMPARVLIGDLDVAVFGVTDHPAEYAATAERAGVNYVDLETGVPQWLAQQLQQCSASEVVMVAPHWGPNMRVRPMPYVRRAASELLAAGAGLVAGHSAHVFHGVAPRVLFDLGDFIDDYAVDTRLRNDLGVLWLLTFDRTSVRRLEAVPLALGYCHTALARGPDAEWIRRRLRVACHEFGTDVVERGDRLEVDVGSGWDLRPLPVSGTGRSVQLRPGNEGSGHE